MQKLTAQHLSEAIAQQLGLSKKISDSFVRAFVETITEGLFTDGVVKVKGLGTFKAVDVEDRESISVKTGERIVIPGFKKLSFSPEDSLTDKIGTIVIPTPETEETDEPTPTAEKVKNDEKEEKHISEEKPVEPETKATETAEQKVTPLKSEVVPAEPEVPTPSQEVDTPEPEAEAEDVQKKNYDTPSATLVSELPKDEAPIKGEVPEIEEEEKEEVKELSPIDKLISDEELSYKKFLDSLTDEELDKYLEEKAIKEEPMDDKFSGIDGVIATPESLKELKEKLKEATSRFETAKDKLQTALDKVNVAKDAVRTAESQVRTARIEYESTQLSVQNLERLIGNVENGKKPAETVKAETSNDAKVVDKAETTKTVATPTEKKTVFTAPASAAPAQPAPTKKEEKPKGFLSRPVLIGLAALALIILAFFLFKPKSRHIENPPVETEKWEQEVAPEEQSQPTEELEPGNPAAVPEQAQPDEQNADPAKAKSEKDEQTQKAATATPNGPRPKVHILQKGEFLTRISMQYYGTKDSVSAILRINDFKNPDVIPPGTEIKLP
jgi:nucleoid DNA-binding protein